LDSLKKSPTRLYQTKEKEPQDSESSEEVAPRHKSHSFKKKSHKKMSSDDEEDVERARKGS
jgi:hypothetical protein